MTPGKQPPEVPLCGETKDGSVKPAYKINTKTTKYAADLTY